MRYSFNQKGNDRGQAMPLLLTSAAVLAVFLILISLPLKVNSEPRSSPVARSWRQNASARDVDLRIDLRVDSTDALPGDILTYTLTVQNRGTKTARNVELTIHAPNPGAPDPDTEGLYTTLFKNNETGFGPGAVTTNSTGRLRSIAWRIDSLPPAMVTAELIEVQLQIIPALDESKALTTTAIITATDFSPSEVSATTHVSLSSDIRIRKVVVTPPVYDVTDTVEYRIYVDNLGNKSEPRVVVRDTIPDGARFVASQPQHLASPDNGGTIFSWNIDNVERNGGRDSVVVWLTFPAPGVYVNAAGGQVDEVPVAGNRVAIEVFGFGDTTGVLPPRFEISKRILTPPPIIVDDPVEYEISVTNLDNVAHSLNVFDYLPSEALVVNAIDTTESLTDLPDHLGWLAQDIPPDSGRFTANVTLRFPDPGDYTNVAIARLDTIPVSSQSTTVTVLPKSNIVAEFTNCAGTSSPGANITLTADISNAGGSDAASVEVAFYVDSISPANKIGDNLQLGTLAMGATQAVDIDFLNTPGGSRLYYVFADPDNLIDETAPFETDNIDSTLCPSPQPPRITVTTPVLCAGEQASFVLETFARLQSGHVLAIFANGEQDTLRTALPAPDSPVNDVFADTRPRLNLPEEAVRFEFHTTDVFDNTNVDIDTLLIKCNDDFKLGENVYRPTMLPDGLQIQFRLSTRRKARLIIYDLAGREITTLYNQEAQAGWNTITWKGNDKSNRAIGAGVYVVTIESGELRGWRKFILVR